MSKKGFIKAEMDKAFPKEQSDRLWNDATVKLSEYLRKYESLPKGVHTHTDSRIFPSSAIYLTIKPILGEDAAYKVIEDAAIAGCIGIQAKLAGLMRVPGMKSLFVKMWDPMTKKIFGSSCGFQNVFYPNKKGEYRMDVTECPYRRYFTELVYSPKYFVLVELLLLALSLAVAIPLSILQKAILKRLHLNCKKEVEK